MAPCAGLPDPTTGFERHLPFVSGDGAFTFATGRPHTVGTGWPLARPTRRSQRGSAIVLGAAPPDSVRVRSAQARRVVSVLERDDWVGESWSQCLPWLISLRAAYVGQSPMFAHPVPPD